MPCFVNEMGITGYGVDFASDFLEFIIFVLEIFQFCGAYKGKVCRIEEENGPFTFYVFVGYCFETSVLESLNLEFREL